jgi:isochorismate synthase
LPSPKNKKRKKLREIIREHFTAGLPFVLYKKPGASRIWALLQMDASLGSGIDLARPGFVMAPFDRENGPPVYLRADKRFTCTVKEGGGEWQGTDPVIDEVAREIHLDLVSRTKEALDKGPMEKVVVSRRFSVPAPGDIVRTFFEMVRRYPNTFCYLWHHPEVGIWMGASPELLLRHHSGVCETLSLAGTRQADPDVSPPVWTTKERHEQALVTHFIEQRMKELRLEPRTGNARDVRAGELWHLGTEIRTSVTAEQAADLLHALHPTPAVCGIPADTAREFILDHENFNREYYTGFLGEVGMEEPGCFEFFVNLRCVQFRNGRAYIYVGGGITSDSTPESEWEETQAKSLVMLSLLTKSG